ncbi:D-serine ammonia-lyase [Corticicoccus populi]|uniref:Probable D-serine dehydratase n=1 Tax=Corticicoccus populi TaxID=1812821 RepID=A0ABW5WYC0_9STAP
MEPSSNNFEIKELKVKYPLLNDISLLQEVFWINPNIKPMEEALRNLYFGKAEIADAERRLERFSPYVMKVFPETQENNGIIESPLVEIKDMKKRLNQSFKHPVQGRLLLKEDNLLPVSGSIKARGGIYEVFYIAEEIAVNEGLLSLDDDYAKLQDERFKQLFSQYTIVVGSTGNLGLSIGIISSELGFNVTVHMSEDAKAWKKDLLKEKGVKVVQHESDYSEAVSGGREAALDDEYTYFIDDENSKNLFLGYAVAASRLKQQLKDMKVKVDSSHPLFVYLPCGVGGGPGGVAFGLKMAFGDNVHCFFAEPTHSPCMLTGLLTGLHDGVSVQDFGIDNKTEADGLAVGRPSRFVGKVMENMISGSYTVTDENMFKLLAQLADTEGVYMEPSALAALKGPSALFNSKAGKRYLESNDITFEKLKGAAHISWGTGGSMVPDDLMNEYYERGKGYIE